MLISAIPVLLYLMHSPGQHKGEDVDGHLGSTRLLKCLKVLRQHPVQPLIGVMPLCMSTLLLASPALRAQGIWSCTLSKAREI